MDTSKDRISPVTFPATNSMSSLEDAKGVVPNKKKVVPESVSFFTTLNGTSAISEGQPTLIFPAKECMA